MTMDPISQEVIEALLSGKAPAGAVPEELAKVKALIDRANAPATYSETTGAHQVVQAFRAAQGGAIPTGGRGKVLSKLLTAKAAAAAAAIVLTGGAAAALTGVVPVSFNSNAHGGLTSNATETSDSVTVTSDTTPTTEAPSSTVTTLFAGESQGMASGANLFGECTAYMAITHGTTTTTPPGSSTTLTGALASTNFQNLAKLATAEGYASINAMCANVSHPGANANANANAIANANANASTHGQAGNNGGNHGGASSGLSAQGSVSVGGGATVGSTPPVTGVPSSVPPVSIPSHPGN